jgi:predicted XRE-type DNA-binding protein
MSNRAQQSSGNVFADLGIAAPEEQLLKAGLVGKLAAIVRARKLTQTQAAKLTGISQPDLSRILRGQFRDFSTDRIIRAIIGLGSDVEIEVTTAGEPVGEPIHLHAAA